MKFPWEKDDVEQHLEDERTVLFTAYNAIADMAERLQRIATHLEALESLHASQEKEDLGNVKRVKPFSPEKQQQVEQHYQSILSLHDELLSLEVEKLVPWLKRSKQQFEKEHAYVQQNGSIPAESYVRLPRFD